MDSKEKDIKNDRLAQIAREREDMDASYRSTMRDMESMDEELMQRGINLSNIMEEEASVNANPQIMDIYQEREEIFREMRAKALEFDEEIRAQYESRLQELDDEEFSLKETLEEDDDDISNSE